VLLRQRPGTAKGITFVTLEDETGTVNLVVHQHTWDRYYRVARRAPAWIAHGHVQTTAKKGDKSNYSAAPRVFDDHAVNNWTYPLFSPVIHVVVRRLEALAEGLGALEVKSRDFR
jgi:error-prone DNA polymerase